MGVLIYGLGAMAALAIVAPAFAGDLTSIEVDPSGKAIAVKKEPGKARARRRERLDRASRGTGGTDIRSLRHQRHWQDDPERQGWQKVRRYPLQARRRHSVPAAYVARLGQWRYAVRIPRLRHAGAEEIVTPAYRCEQKIQWRQPHCMIGSTAMQRLNSSVWICRCCESTHRAKRSPQLQLR